MGFPIFSAVTQPSHFISSPSFKPEMGQIWAFHSKLCPALHNHVLCYTWGTWSSSQSRSAAQHAHVLEKAWLRNQQVHTASPRTMGQLLFHAFKTQSPLLHNMQKEFKWSYHIMGETIKTPASGIGYILLSCWQRSLTHKPTKQTK